MKLRKAQIPTLHDLVLYAQDRGLVGDEKTFLTALLAMLNRNLHVIIEAPSGAGKTEVAKTIMTLLEPGTVFTMSPASDKADLYDTNMHASKTLFVPELQKIGLASDYVVEMLKDFGEGRDYTYRVTRSGHSFAERRPENIEIPYKNFLTTFAIQNKKYHELLDVELSRRLVRLSTDVSVKQNEAVKKDKARRAKEAELKDLCPVSTADIQLHLSKVVREFENSSVVIPYADYVNDAIDSVFVASRTVISQAFELIKAITMFHYGRRRVRKGENGEKIYVAEPEDAYLFSVIMHESLREQALQLPPLGMSILRIFNEITDKEAEEIATRDNKQTRFGEYGEGYPIYFEPSLTPADVQERLRKKNYVLDVKVIVEALNTLSSAGYLRIDESHKGKYKKYIRMDMKINLRTLRLDRIYDFMNGTENKPAIVITRKVKSPFTGNSVFPYDPMPGDTEQTTMLGIVKPEQTPVRDEQYKATQASDQRWHERTMADIILTLQGTSGIALQALRTMLTPEYDIVMVERAISELTAKEACDNNNSILSLGKNWKNYVDVQGATDWKKYYDEEGDEKNA